MRIRAIRAMRMPPRRILVMEKKKKMKNEMVVMISLEKKKRGLQMVMISLEKRGLQTIPPR